MSFLEHALIGVHPLVVYLGIAGVVLLESMGIPLPGETVIMAAAVLSAANLVDASPLGIAIAGSIGAIAGDSAAYWLVRRHGDRLLHFLHRHFPRHVEAVGLAWAERLFARFGFWAVFLGRFVALLRMFAGPISGLLRMRYPVFLAANALGGITWSFATTWVIYLLGLAAERWLKDAAWAGLLVVIAVGVVVTLVLRRRQGRVLDSFAAEYPDEVLAAGERLTGPR